MLLHDVQVAAFYPPHALLYLLPEDKIGAALSWLVVLHVLIAGWCMYAYARGQDLGRAGALVAVVPVDDDVDSAVLDDCVDDDEDDAAETNVPSKCHFPVKLLKGPPTIWLVHSST